MTSPNAERQCSAAECPWPVVATLHTPGEGDSADVDVCLMHLETAIAVAQPAPKRPVLIAQGIIDNDMSGAVEQPTPGVRPLSAVLDALDAKLAEMTVEPWEVEPSGIIVYTDADDLPRPVDLDGTNATGLALIRNMAASLVAAVRAGDAMRVAAKRVSTIAEMDVLITEFDTALDRVVAAAEVK